MHANQQQFLASTQVENHLKMQPSSSSTLILSLTLLLLISLPSPAVCAAKCNPQDKQALLQIKAAFNNPYILASWDPNTDCCSWYALQCDSKSPYRVIALTIFSGNLSGQIPPAIGNLPYLQMIDFNHLSNVTGPIPSAISNLKNLNFLRLSYLSLSGTIPTFISQLSKLTFLDLSFNNLSGPIPPQLSQLQNLNAIRLSGNSLSGPIPDSFGRFKGNTPDLFLSQNQLSGAVPFSLGYLNFTSLDFSSNILSGDISFLFGKNKTIQIVDFSNNMFRFNLSNVVFPNSLTSLDLSHNKIYGGIPSQITQLDLQYLNVSYNQLCGQIPQGGKLQSFDSTSYSNNRCLCGNPLPSC